jgi:predicted nucleic acid-binding protein
MLLIADTSVLINFLNVDGMYLIGRHAPRCVITEHVLAEVTDLYSRQRERLLTAINDGHLEVVSVSDAAEVELFGRILDSGRIGSGESSAIAVAIHRKYALAIDDRRASRAAQALAGEEGAQLTIWGTQDLIVRLITSGQLSVAQADILLVSWRNDFRFTLPIKSFAELVQPVIQNESGT